ARRRSDDHLSLVAGISARQRQALVGRNVATLEALGDLDLPMSPRLDGSSEGALRRIREQARIQLVGRREGTLKYELLVPAPGLPIDPERGLASLPRPSPGDLFLDLEGDPYALEEGLDYLFGVLEVGGTFHAFWSKDARGDFSAAGEQAAFERAMDFIMARYRADPSLHVYHYAPYEPSALKRLMGRYGTREDEVDELRRKGVLVDLLRAVRQSLRASVESYSLKRLEPFYGFSREIDLRDAGSSIVAFEQWLELGEGDRPAAHHLEQIERYNRDDVVSTLRLRDWLEERRQELSELTGLSVPRPAARETPLPAELTAAQARTQALAARLADPAIAAVPLAERDPANHARWLLAQLLGWHRREDKSMWWEFHRLMDLSPEQLVDEDAPIGMLTPLGPLDEESNNRQVWRYRFPAQEHDLGRNRLFEPRRKQADPDANPFSWAVGDLVAVDPAERVLDIRRIVADPHPTAVVPLPWIPTPEHQKRLYDIGEWVAEHDIDTAGPYRAARDLLLGGPPRTRQDPGEPLCGGDETVAAAARRLVLRLDHGVLPIQGPPGSGKTYTGARMICDLVRAGKRVGISGTSHKVIGNLLRAALAAAEEEDVPIRPVQRGDPEQLLADSRVMRGRTPGEVRDRLDDGGANVAAGTAWLWTSPRMLEAVDVLFVDEAGQISLANVIAMSPSTASVVLLGDPQQLDQPLQGSHPPGADRSALGHVLGAEATLAPDRGLFLETTWRLHPTLCDFTSEVFYDDRLAPEAHLHIQRLHAPDQRLDGTGPRFVGVPTQGADSESPAEAEAVASLARSLVGSASWTDESGRDRRLSWEDVLIVAPFNAQVGAIRRLLPAEARVGTVDKFQGQEGVVTFFSMATSSAAELPRNIDFLFSRNRLNVAVSRARCLAVLVCSPDLLHVRCRSAAQMRLVNALCLLVEQSAATMAS
nr:TM0106 family RecB-like putative nuclease [Chloroflexota bacterium]